MVTTPIASPPLDAITTALLDLFKGTGRTVHDGAYSGDPIAPAYPYAILYSTAGGSADPIPDLDKRSDEITATWQVTAVSNRRNQAELTRRQLRDRLLARHLEHPDQTYANTAGWVYPIACPAGWQIVDRNPDPAMPGVDRTGDVPAAIFSAPLLFTLTVVPA